MESSEDTQAGERPGLRERKRQQTRERLTAAAMGLFLERGFEATTLDEIVAAADVSRRTFFHYFASKEDLVFAWQDSITAEMIAAVEARPPEEPPLHAAEQAILATIAQLSHADTLALTRLIHDTPALRARDQAKYQGLERSLAEALSKRMGCAPGNLRPQLAAMVAIGALRVSTEAWLAEAGREPPDEYARRAFQALREIL